MRWGNKPWLRRSMARRSHIVMPDYLIARNVDMARYPFHRPYMMRRLARKRYSGGRVMRKVLIVLAVLAIAWLVLNVRVTIGRPDPPSGRWVTEVAPSPVYATPTVKRP